MILLIGVVVWEAIDLKGMYGKIASARSEDADDADQRLASLRGQLVDYRGYIENLEELALWQPETDPMSWLTQQADDSDVQIIGVEHQPVEDISGYQHVPVKITVRGDYNPLGRFINKLEYSPNAVRIDSFRIRRKQYTPEHITMDLSLSYFQKLEKP